MYAKGFDDGKPSNAWVAALPRVVADMNSTTTRLTGLAPDLAITMARVPLSVRGDVSKLASFAVGTMVHVALNEEAKDVDERRRATDPWWTAKSYPITKRIITPGEPQLYYVAEQGKHGFTRSQLRIAKITPAKAPLKVKAKPAAKQSKQAKPKPIPKQAAAPKQPTTRVGRTTKIPARYI